MATLIGLAIRVKLLRSLPPRFKVSLRWQFQIVQLHLKLPNVQVTVRITPGSHASEDASEAQLKTLKILEILTILFPVNKQLADKERVAAALENGQLLELVNQCLALKD